MNKDLYELLKNDYYKKKYDQLEETAIEYENDCNDFIND